jgi:hypothetical protein
VDKSVQRAHNNDAVLATKRTAPKARDSIAKIFPRAFTFDRVAQQNSEYHQRHRPAAAIRAVTSPR